MRSLTVAAGSLGSLFHRSPGTRERLVRILEPILGVYPSSEAIQSRIVVHASSSEMRGPQNIP